MCSSGPAPPSQSNANPDAASKLPYSPSPLSFPSPSTFTESFICCSYFPQSPLLSSPPPSYPPNSPHFLCQSHRGQEGTEKFGACNAFLTGTSISFPFSLVSWGLLVNPISYTALSLSLILFSLFAVPSSPTFPAELRFTSTLANPDRTCGLRSQ